MCLNDVGVSVCKCKYFMLIQLIIWNVCLSLHKEFFENHVNHKQKVLMNVGTHMLEFYLELLEQAWNENPYQSTRQYLRYLKLPNKEHHS